MIKATLKGFSDSVTGTWSYTYDYVNRLRHGQSSSGYYAGLVLDWTYDAFGNRLTQTPSGTSNKPIPGPQTLSFSDGNRITSSQYTLDGAGNVTSDGLNTYLYDAEDRVCAEYNTGMSGQVTQYIYDAMGDRVAKGTSSVKSCDPTMNGTILTNNYVLGPGGEQIEEYDGTGNNLIHSNVFGNGKLLATYTGSTWYYPFTDWLGTKRAQITADGNVANESTFLSLPFGDGLTSTGPDATEQHFTGKERDTESGLDNFGARYYGSSMGRFMSPDYSDDDSIGEPIPYFNPSNPQSLNLYSYAHNNPLTGSDPDGHSVQICSNDASGNQKCTTVDNPTYDKAASGNNGGLNVPSEQQVERTGSGNITDSNGNVVGTVKYVADSGLDGPANLAGANMIGNGGMGAIKVFAAGSVVGGAIGGAALATGVVGGAAELTTLGDLSPNVQLTEHGALRLAQRGISQGQIQEAVDAAKKAGDVVQKVGRYGTKQLEYTANGLKVFVEQEGANAGKVITAYFH